MDIEKTYLIKQEIHQGKHHEVTIGRITVEGKNPATRINRAMLWCAENSEVVEERHLPDKVLVYTVIGEYTGHAIWQYKNFEHLF